MPESQDVSKTAYAAMVAAKPDVIVCHNPAFGRVDDKKGCKLIAKMVEACGSCKLFVCGHVRICTETVMDQTQGGPLGSQLETHSSSRL